MTLNPLAKFALDTVPVFAFFGVYKLADLYTATAVLLVLTLVSLLIFYLVERRLAFAPLVTAALVALFGGLTLWLHDDDFIKMKPTLVYLVFAATLLGGCIAKKGLIRYVFGAAFHLTEAGWYVLSRRWGIFFLALAALNELVRRNFTTSQWVNFKVFGALTLTVLFAVLQTRFIEKHQEKK